MTLGELRQALLLLEGDVPNAIEVRLEMDTPLGFQGPAVPLASIRIVREVVTGQPPTCVVLVGVADQ